MHGRSQKTPLAVGWSSQWFCLFNDMYTWMIISYTSHDCILSFKYSVESTQPTQPDSESFNYHTPLAIIPFQNDDPPIGTTERCPNACSICSLEGWRDSAQVVRTPIPSGHIFTRCLKNPETRLQIKPEVVHFQKYYIQKSTSQYSQMVSIHHLSNRFSPKTPKFWTLPHSPKAPHQDVPEFDDTPHPQSGSNGNLEATNRISVHLPTAQGQDAIAGMPSTTIVVVCCSNTTVDGWNPAPPGMYETL